MIVCSVLYGFRRANSKNSVDPVDANNVCSVVMATFSMFIMPSLLLCARNISIVRRSRIRSSFSRCIDYKSHAHHPTTKQLCQPNTVSPLLQKITKHWVCSPVYLVPVPSQDKLQGLGDDGAGSWIGPDRVVPSQIVGVSASVIFPCIIKSRRFLGPAHPCSPGKRAIKWIYTPKNCLQRDIFLTDIVGYDQLKLYLKIYTPKMKSWVCCCPL